MINVVTFRGHTISALPYLLGDRLWGATYTVCLRGEVVCNSNDAPLQSTAGLAQSAAVLTAIRYIEDRLLARR